MVSKERQTGIAQLFSERNVLIATNNRMLGDLLPDEPYLNWPGYRQRTERRNIVIEMSNALARDSDSVLASIEKNPDKEAIKHRIWRALKSEDVKTAIEKINDSVNGTATYHALWMEFRGDYSIRSNEETSVASIVPSIIGTVFGAGCAPPPQFDNEIQFQGESKSGLIEVNSFSTIDHPGYINVDFNGQIVPVSFETDASAMPKVIATIRGSEGSLTADGNKAVFALFDFNSKTFYYQKEGSKTFYTTKNGVSYSFSKDGTVYHDTLDAEKTMNIFDYLHDPEILNITLKKLSELKEVKFKKTKFIEPENLNINDNYVMANYNGIFLPFILSNSIRFNSPEDAFIFNGKRTSGIMTSYVAISYGTFNPYGQRQLSLYKLEGNDYFSVSKNAVYSFKNEDGKFVGAIDSRMLYAISLELSILGSTRINSLGSITGNSSGLIETSLTSSLGDKNILVNYEGILIPHALQEDMLLSAPEKAFTIDGKNFSSFLYTFDLLGAPGVIYKQPGRNYFNSSAPSVKYDLTTSDASYSGVLIADALEERLSHFASFENRKKMAGLTLLTSIEETHPQLITFSPQQHTFDGKYAMVNKNGFLESLDLGHEFLPDITKTDAPGKAFTTDGKNVSSFLFTPNLPGAPGVIYKQPGKDYFNLSTSPLQYGLTTDGVSHTGTLSTGDLDAFSQLETAFENTKASQNLTQLTSLEETHPPVITFSFQTQDSYAGKYIQINDSGFSRHILLGPDNTSDILKVDARDDTFSYNRDRFASLFSFFHSDAPYTLYKKLDRDYFSLVTGDITIDQSKLNSPAPTSTITFDNISRYLEMGSSFNNASQTILDTFNQMRHLPLPPDILAFLPSKVQFAYVSEPTIIGDTLYLYPGFDAYSFTNIFMKKLKTQNFPDFLNSAVRLYLDNRLTNFPQTTSLGATTFETTMIQEIAMVVGDEKFFRACFDSNYDMIDALRETLGNDAIPNYIYRFGLFFGGERTQSSPNINQDFSIHLLFAAKHAGLDIGSLVNFIRNTDWSIPGDSLWQLDNIQNYNNFDISDFYRYEIRSIQPSTAVQDIAYDLRKDVFSAIASLDPSIPQQAVVIDFLASIIGNSQNDFTPHGSLNEDQKNSGYRFYNEVNRLLSSDLNQNYIVFNSYLQSIAVNELAPRINTSSFWNNHLTYPIKTGDIEIRVYEDSRVSETRLSKSKILRSEITFTDSASPQINQSHLVRVHFENGVPEITGLTVTTSIITVQPDQ